MTRISWVYIVCPSFIALFSECVILYYIPMAKRVGTPVYLSKVRNGSQSSTLYGQRDRMAGMNRIKREDRDKRRKVQVRVKGKNEREMMPGAGEEENVGRRRMTTMTMTTTTLRPTEIPRPATRRPRP
jgi:hypothetical protein